MDQDLKINVDETLLLLEKNGNIMETTCLPNNYTTHCDNFVSLSDCETNNNNFYIDNDSFLCSLTSYDTSLEAMDATTPCIPTIPYDTSLEAMDATTPCVPMIQYSSDNKNPPVVCESEPDSCSIDVSNSECLNIPLSERALIRELVLDKHEPCVVASSGLDNSLYNPVIQRDPSIPSVTDDKCTFSAAVSKIDSEQKSAHSELQQISVNLANSECAFETSEPGPEPSLALDSLIDHCSHSTVIVPLVAELTISFDPPQDALYGCILNDSETNNTEPDSQLQLHTELERSQPLPEIEAPVLMPSLGKTTQDCPPLEYVKLNNEEQRLPEPFLDVMKETSCDSVTEPITTCSVLLQPSRESGLQVISRPEPGLASLLPAVVLEPPLSDDCVANSDLCKEEEAMSTYYPSSSACLRSSLVVETQDDSESDSSDWDAPIEVSLVRTKPWKKIRNMIMWSPFIQQFKKQRYPWVQLAGHQGNFLAGDQGTILKKMNSREHRCLCVLMSDVLRPYIPQYQGDVERDGCKFVLLQDLLCSFETPCVMDVKMGVRTYLEEELHKARENPKMRKDMYEKMIDVDPNAPTAEEHSTGGVTKPRYMQWRETISSSANLGFRIEGIKMANGTSSKDFKKTQNPEQIAEVLHQFTNGDINIITKYIRRLKAIRGTQESSAFIASHELIGSSLLFLHDQTGKVGAWMIDFGKTTPLPPDVTVDHRSEWVEGNHEDGYLFGVDGLISLFESLLSTSSV